MNWNVSLQLAVGQLAQVEQNLEFARDLQKNVMQMCNEVSKQAVTGLLRLTQKYESKLSGIQMDTCNSDAVKIFVNPYIFAVNFLCFF